MVIVLVMHNINSTAAGVYKFICIYTQILYSCIEHHHNIMPADDCSTGDVRLVGGEHEAEGRVELCISGRWETLCDNEWTDNHTAVVCRHLGFSDIIGGVYYTRAINMERSS